MSPLNVHLTDLIAGLDGELPGVDELAKVSEAQRRSHTLAAISDQFVGHYVAKAREAGASWSQIGEAIGVSKQAAQQRWVPTLFERFTNRARHVVVLAQEWASDLHHTHIGTEHLLLGLLGEPDGLAAHILIELAGSADVVEQAVRDRIPPGTANLRGHIPFTPEGKKALEETARAGADLGHDFLGTEHLLLGLLAVTEGGAAPILNGLGITAETVRTRTVEKLAAYLAAQPPTES